MLKSALMTCGGIAALTALLATSLPVDTVRAAGLEEESKVFAIGSENLQRIYHDERVLPDKGHAGFGSLLFDTDGRLVLHEGTKTWLYTTAR